MVPNRRSGSGKCLALRRFGLLQADCGKQHAELLLCFGGLAFRIGCGHPAAPVAIVDGRQAEIPGLVVPHPDERAAICIETALVGNLRGALREQRRGREMGRSEEHTSELQSLMRISYAVFCLKKKK